MENKERDDFKMFIKRNKDEEDLDKLSLEKLKSLYEKYRIEVPTISWNDQNFIRVSIQGYTTFKDSQNLVNALGEIL